MRGFTLIETIVTIAIFALIMGVVSGFLVVGYRVQGYTFQQAVAIGEARKGVEIMVKEIREARPGDDGSYIIEKADNYEFIFYSDIDKDEATERVRYFIEGTNFKKGVIEPQGWPITYNPANENIVVLSQYVRNLPPIFHYYNGQGEELIDLPTRLKDTKLMKVYLVINIDPSRPPQNFELESAVQIRNLKTNL
ncbi:MAG: hypothetical protein COT59_00095 [Candidatus Nealsonbacteria bacterium CG09_land_8_20_14_0_10_42_14]|uniref:Prepilin-type N-terminal cleavage/methylation domain-containing protein n=1 Tax=Candidatus Nealsonbacteria bacterium CG09_land_8_20_14_0_10_42_14 TaxID=1974707 RepID=A0A2H0WXZ8_9BACT|nr:MAG: hypothetical protein COT59_00095 [Candidatus Nealsonbacteria bacterium CG09_land_8_20_14_0_10_42_14]